MEAENPEQDIERDNIDFLRGVIASAKERGISPTTVMLAKLVLRQNEIQAGLKFYDETADGDLRLFTRKRKPRKERRKHLGAVLCGAKTRRGTPCQCLPVEGRKRCRFHGGMSTGPRTAQGRARIAESNRRRAGKQKQGAHKLLCLSDD